MNAIAYKARRLATLGTLALAVAAPALTMLGCKQPVLCPPLASCGAKRDSSGQFLRPIGEWVLAAGHPSCTEDLYVPANDTRLGLATIPAVGTPYPEPALFDWCILLVTGPGAGVDIQRTQPRFYYESGPIGTAVIKYSENGDFAAGISRTGTFTLEFPPFCVRAFGAMAGPLDPTDPLTPTVDVCKRLEVPVKASGRGEGSYMNTTCELNTADPPGEEGCLCHFDVTEAGGPVGTYSLQNENTLLHLPGKNFPQRATFCNEGDTLQLTGTDDSYLFDQRGVRTFDLVRSCGDNAQCSSGVCDMTAHVCSK